MNDQCEHFDGCRCVDDVEFYGPQPVSLVKAVPVLPEYVTVHAQGMTADVVVGGVVVISLPPRVWLRERSRAVSMIRRELRACGVTL